MFKTIIIKLFTSMKLQNINKLMEMNKTHYGMMSGSLKKSINKYIPTIACK